MTGIVDRPAGRARVPVMTRTEVAGLLAMMAHYDGRTPGEADLFWWRDALSGYTAPECQAAIFAHSKHSPGSITPADIIARIKGAHRMAEARIPRAPADPQTHRARHATAARRGMAAVYAEMGWNRSPEQAAALYVPCPVAGCGAQPGVICADVNRTEARDRASRVHPSRVTAGRDAPPSSTQEVPA